MRVPGVIKGREISILIHSGSTHSFIDDELARELNLAIDGTKTSTVRMENGEKLESKALYSPLTWKVQNWEFQCHLRTLKLCGSEIVLGLNWMSRFCPIMFNFTLGIIKFKHEGTEVNLRSKDTVPDVKMIGVEKMKNLFRRNSCGIDGQLYTITKGEKKEILKQITEIINQCPGVFEEPRVLPPLGPMTTRFH